MKKKTPKNRRSPKTTECDVHLEEVSLSLRRTITEISSVVITECPGIEGLTPAHIAELRTVLNTLAEIRDKHFTDRRLK